MRFSLIVFSLTTSLSLADQTVFTDPDTRRCDRGSSRVYGTCCYYYDCPGCWFYQRCCYKPSKREEDIGACLCGRNKYSQFGTCY
ncbi:uncharacterized protein BKA55DRAFT_574150 [Fusarium redolens]|uniref:Uncharacterized protein n=1 Tax=Fusarium redolens TaxID=48865 RepID=A0A9P9GTR7_FUSRE|nr:uncharacterized protein BKA55DRAFT_574150 [Fusarium redolens]KAH7244592.1 hypothetical protein BKA55DRAFT_574150 [Fusarium redolens]